MAAPPIAPVIAQLPIVDERGFATPAFLRILASIGNVIQGPGGILDQINGGSAPSPPASGDISLTVQQALLQQTPSFNEAQTTQAQLSALSVFLQSAQAPSQVTQQQLAPDTIPDVRPVPGCVTSVLFNTGARLSAGFGAPNGVVYGSVGDLFLRQDGTAGSVFYVKESGNLTNTGWTGK